MKPDRKVVAGGLTGAVVTVLIWLASLFGYELEPEVATSIVMILSFIVSYFVPEGLDAAERIAHAHQKLVVDPVRKYEIHSYKE